MQHAANPAHGAGSSETARLVQNLLAPALGIGLDGPVIDVVDIGANPIDGDPPYRRLLDSGLCRVTGFEPQPQALADLRRQAGPARAVPPVRGGRRRSPHVAPVRSLGIRQSAGAGR